MHKIKTAKIKVKGQIYLDFKYMSTIHTND